MSDIKCNNELKLWQCHLKTWSDFHGYGFECHEKKGKIIIIQVALQCLIIPILFFLVDSCYFCVLVLFDHSNDILVAILQI